MPDSMVLGTTFCAGGGVHVLTDALALGDEERGHDIGGHAPHAILRVVECVEGRVELDVDLAIRGGYGLTVPVPVPERRGGGVRARRST